MNQAKVALLKNDDFGALGSKLGGSGQASHAAANDDSIVLHIRWCMSPHSLVYCSYSPDLKPWTSASAPELPVLAWPAAVRALQQHATP